MTVLCYRYVARHNQKAEAAGNNQSVIGSCVGNKVSAVTVSGMHSELPLHYRPLCRSAAGMAATLHTSSQPSQATELPLTVLSYYTGIYMYCNEGDDSTVCRYNLATEDSTATLYCRV